MWEKIWDKMDNLLSKNLFNTASMDLTELQRNCKFHNVEYNFPYPFIFYDIQKLYSKCYSDGKSRIALETAVTEQNMTKDIEFHSAYDDAVYTARIFQHMDFNKFKIYTSIDTYRIPMSRKEEITMNYGEYTLTIKLALAAKAQFDTVTDLVTEIVPSNILCEIGILYNKYRTVSRLTYEEWNPEIVILQLMLTGENRCIIEYVLKADFENSDMNT